MEKVRRQHYVPRMYLKRFGYGNIDDEYISVLKLDTGKVNQLCDSADTEQ